MLRLDRILFPVDFSDGCVATGLQVKALAEEFHSEIVLLFAMAPFSAHMAALDGFVYSIRGESGGASGEGASIVLSKWPDAAGSQCPTLFGGKGPPKPHWGKQKKDCISVPCIWRRIIIGLIHPFSPMYPGTVHKLSPCLSV